MRSSFTICEAPQRSEPWFAARLGKVTSSRAADFLATLKNGGEAAGRRNYRVQLCLERITGRSHEREYQSDAMRAGIEREADALAAYEAMTGELVQRVGFVAHDTLMAGGSPDGVLDDFDGLAECKCPLPATHLDFLKTGAVPGEYLKQCQHLLWLTGATWCDYFSFNADFPDGLRVKVARLTMTTAERDSWELGVRQFLREIDAEVDTILRLQESRAVCA